MKPRPASDSPVESPGYLGSKCACWGARIGRNRYHKAYGRRRLRAVKELGRKVAALVRTMSDELRVLAQGQEKSACTT